MLKERLPEAKRSLIDVYVVDLCPKGASAKTDSVADQGATPDPRLVTDQARRHSGNLVTTQVEPLIELSEKQWKILEFCDVPRRLKEIMMYLGVTGRNHFKRRHLDPLIHDGLVAMTNPGTPRAPNQHYVITDAGARLKVHRTDKG